MADSLVIAMLAMTVFLRPSARKKARQHAGTRGGLSLSCGDPPVNHTFHKASIMVTRNHGHGNGDCRHSRTLFDPDDTGEARKKAAHELLERHRAELLLRARHALLGLLLQHGEATADDVRAVVPLPKGVNATAFGAVPGPLQKAGIIKRTGWAPSVRPDSHARPVSVWQIVSSAKALEWLQTHPLPGDEGRQNG